MFCLRLSREMGIPFKELIKRIDLEEIILYELCEREFPSLPDPWTISGLNCAVTANSAMGSSGKSKIDDFVPYKTKKQKSAAELKAVASLIAAKVKAAKESKCKNQPKSDK